MAARTAVVLADATIASSAAVQWAVQHWWRPGDAVHVVHAVCCLLPKLEIYHSARGVTSRHCRLQRHEWSGYGMQGLSTRHLRAMCPCAMRLWPNLAEVP